MSTHTEEIRKLALKIAYELLLDPRTSLSGYIKEMSVKMPGGVGQNA